MATTTMRFRSIQMIQAHVPACERCERLRNYCAEVGRTKKRAYMNDDYWARPVPSFGDPKARLVIVGLAPGAHGANRTGRIFTGDQSGHFLFAALHRSGYANQPTSIARDDGLTLTDCYITMSARCAPPGNKPLPQELRNCAPYLDAEFDLLKQMRVILVLGSIAWDQTVAALVRQGRITPTATPIPRFAHGATVSISPTLTLVGSYHVSQQNTFTGRLTPAMFDAILQRSRDVYA